MSKLKQFYYIVEDQKLTGEMLTRSIFSLHGEAIVNGLDLNDLIKYQSNLVMVHDLLTGEDSCLLPFSYNFEDAMIDFPFFTEDKLKEELKDEKYLHNHHDI